MFKSYHPALTLRYGSLVPPSKYRCPVCDLVALHSAWRVVCALLLFFVLTVASKAVALCGVAIPSIPLCVRLSCSQHFFTEEFIIDDLGPPLGVC